MSDSVRFSKTSDADLMAMVDAGHKVGALMDGNNVFGAKVVPAINREMVRIQEGHAWTPGATAPTIEAVALDRVWKSGMVAGMKYLWRVIDCFKNEGKEAAAELERREKNAKKE